MNEREWLAERFEDNRAHLRAVAYRVYFESVYGAESVRVISVPTERVP